MTTRTRRTPEQLAAYHQGKANQARAQARKMAKDAKIREQIELGKAAQAAGLADEDDLQAHLTLANLLIRDFGTGGEKGSEKLGYHFAALEKFFRLGGAEGDRLRQWWASKKLPLGPEPDGGQG